MSGIYKRKSRYEKKTADIQKSLVHRARLRKAYFKMLEREGEEVPEKRERSSRTVNSSTQTLVDSTTDKTNSEEQLSDGEAFFEEEANAPRSEAKNKGEKKYTERKEENRMKYEDRRQIVKQRKRDNKQELEAQRRSQAMDKSHREELRSKHKKQMRKFTTKGQPVLSSRIDRLLDKIKEQES